MRVGWIACLLALAACGGGRAPAGGGGGAGGGGVDAGDAGDGGEAGPPARCSGPGTWTVAVEETVGRYAPGVAVLSSGRVLIAGGWNATTQLVLPGAKIFDPAGDTLTSAGNLSQARNFPAVAPVPGGFLFAGGFNDGIGSSARADVYAEAKGKLSATGMLKKARELFSAVALPDGRVAVIGGLSAVGLKVLPDAEIYDPVVGTFTASGNLIHPRFGEATLYVPSAGKVLVVGGKYTGSGGDAPVPEAEWFDPATGTFTPAGALSRGRDRATASFLPDGRVLVAGGSNGTDGTLASTEIFDPETSTFTAGPTMTARRMAHSATPLADGRVVMVGGWSDSTMPSASSSAAEVFDPAAMAFTALPPISVGRHDHGAARLGSCGVLVVGGLSAATGQASTTPLALERIDLSAP